MTWIEEVALAMSSRISGKKSRPDTWTSTVAAVVSSNGSARSPSLTCERTSCSARPRTSSMRRSSWRAGPDKRAHTPIRRVRARRESARLTRWPPQLAEEQEHLDLTFAAYDALLDALSVSRRNRQGRSSPRRCSSGCGSSACARTPAPAGRSTSAGSTGRGRGRCTSGGTRSPTRATGCWRSTGARRPPSRSTPPRRPTRAASAAGAGSTSRSAPCSGSSTSSCRPGRSTSPRRSSTTSPASASARCARSSRRSRRSSTS